jgi:hypothetical protein
VRRGAHAVADEFAGAESHALCLYFLPLPQGQGSLRPGFIAG